MYCQIKNYRTYYQSNHYFFQDYLLEAYSVKARMRFFQASRTSGVNFEPISSCITATQMPPNFCTKFIYASLIRQFVFNLNVDIYLEIRFVVIIFESLESGVISDQIRGDVRQYVVEASDASVGQMKEFLIGAKFVHIHVGEHGEKLLSFGLGFEVAEKSKTHLFYMKMEIVK